MLLHGGFCSLEHLRFLAEALSGEFTVFAFERPGHGRSADSADAFSYATGVAQTVAYLDAMKLGSAHLVGFSDGAVIALMLGIEHPERVRSLVAISGNLNPSGFIGTAADIDAGEMAEGLDSTLRLYGALSPDGPEHARVVLEKLAVLWATQPDIDPAELVQITVPSLVMAGEFDTIHLAHTQLIAQSLGRAEVCIVDGASHDLIEERPDVVMGAVRGFLRNAQRCAPG